jgi:NAD(P)-dependent dehydrogenase (short-subunit alcohol dehydrogenase family)
MSDKSERKERVWFITGTSTGFGRLLAEEALKAGNKVVATARNVATISDLEKKYPEKALALTLDVTKPEQIAPAVDAALKKFGRIDVLVNNAGYGLFGAVEEVSEEEMTRQIDTNVYGLLRVTRAVLPQMRKQRSGHIINLSSIAGLIGLPGLGLYNLTKHAVEGVSEALAAEVAPLGIRVLIIEPGPFRTDFHGRSGVFAKKEIPDYAETVGVFRETTRGFDGKQKGDPMRAVHTMMELVDDPNPPLRLLMGALALGRYRTKTKQWGEDVDRWEAVTLATDFPD